MRRFSTHIGTIVFVVVVVAALGALVPWAVAAPAESPRLSPTDAAEIASATPFEDHFAGQSLLEPEFCRHVTELRRDVVENSISADGALSVSPASTEVAGIGASKVYRHCLLVHNRHSTANQYALTAVEIIGSPNPDQQQAIIDPPVGLGRWIHPLTNSFELKPGERIFIPFVVRVPATLPGGTISAGIKVTEVAQKPPGNTRIQVSVLHRIYITSPGGTAQKLKISAVSAPRWISHNNDPVAYRAKFVVSNEGTVIDSYDVRLNISGFGRKVGSAKVDTSAILPAGSNRAVVVLRDLPWIGWYRPTVTVAGREGPVDVDVPSLFIIPKRIYLIIAALALLLPIGARLAVGARRRAEWRDYLDDEALENDEFNADEAFDGTHGDHDVF